MERYMFYILHNTTHLYTNTMERVIFSDIGVSEKRWKDISDANLLLKRG